MSRWPRSAGLEPRLALQREAEEEVAAFLGRARYERTPEALARGTATGQASADRGGRAGDPGAAGPGYDRALREQRDPERPAALRTRPLG